MGIVKEKLPRILFIMHMPPPVHGAAMVGKYIHDSRLVNEAFDCRYINLATAANLEDIGKVRLAKFVDFSRLLRRIRKEYMTFRPDLVYVTPNAGGGAFLKDFVVVQMLKSMGARVVVHYHNKGVSNYQQKPLFDFCYKRFFRNIKVILLSKFLYQDFSKYVDKENVEICPNGIPELFTEEPCFIRDNRPIKILYLSNLIISKGVYVLLDALQILKSRGYAITCTFVGGETKEISVEIFNRAVKERQLDDIVVYAGSKYGQEKQPYWVQSDIFVFPTFYHNESFPIVNLEAMQYKLPIVSTDEGGIKDIVEDSIIGYIVPKQNAGALAEKIAVLIDNEELRHNMGNAGYLRYKKYFTLSVFEHKMTDILNRYAIQS